MDAFFDSGDFVRDMTDEQFDRLLSDVRNDEPTVACGDDYAILRGLGLDPQSDEALTMDGPMATTAVVEPDHLLRLWAQIDRCAEVAAEALVADLARTSDLLVRVDGVKSTVATELWCCVQDSIGLARLGAFEEWSEDA